MPISPKNWQDAPSTATPLTAVALEDMETRLGAYTDDARQAEDVKQHGAVGDGVANDTAEIQAALAVTGVAFLPPGTYLVNDLPLASFERLIGAGQEVSKLKADAGATYAVTMDSGVVFAGLTDLGIDGNAGASRGLLIRGDTGAGSQGQTLDRVHVRNCSVGITVGASTGTEAHQADKNTYIGLRFADCDVGMHINSANAQEQVLLNPDFASCVTAIELKSGTLDIIGGQIQGTTVGLKGIDILTGGSVAWVRLNSTIFEFADAASVDIDATDNAWPSEGMVLNHCVLAGLTSNIACNTGGILISQFSRFNAGGLDLAGDDFYFHDFYSTFESGATYNPTGTNCRRVKWGAAEMLIEIGTLGKIQLRPHEGIWLGTSEDVLIQRIAANIAGTGTGDKWVATAGLGVGNSASATEVIGKAVVKKIEVFDAAGSSLGFIPVYSSIS